jgi:hypothetical protein
MRKTLYASVLVLALCGAALAGDISCPPIAPGDIPSPPSAAQPSGDQTNDGSTNTETPDSTAAVLAETTLTVINTVLALL